MAKLNTKEEDEEELKKNYQETRKNWLLAMGDSRRIDVGNLITFCDDLVGVLKNTKDINFLMQSLEGVKLLQSSCEADFSEVHNPLEAYQKKINECQLRIVEAKNEVVDDEVLDSLSKELEEELQRERSLQEELSDKISNLEHERVYIEEQKQILKKVEKDRSREQRKLSLYASVTNIIPHADDDAKISGQIVEREKQMVEKFEFDPANASSTEICNSLWKMISL